MENSKCGSKRFFYVVYFFDPTVQALLDAIRLLSNPQEKGRAHITIRGPYSRQQSLSKLERLIRGTQVCAQGLGTFFDEGQNTVSYTVIPNTSARPGRRRTTATTLISRFMMALHGSLQSICWPSCPPSTSTFRSKQMDFRSCCRIVDNGAATS